LSRIAAEEFARTSREVRALVREPKKIAAEAATLFAARTPFGSADGAALSLVCAKNQSTALANWLIGKGAEHVGVSALDYIFSAENDLFARLAKRLSAKNLG
jgi:ATP phosphoribosyltransferase